LTGSVPTTLVDLLRALPPYQLDPEDDREGRGPLPGGTTLEAARYLLGEEIGAGAFGIIYSATDRRTGQVLAVKEFFPKGCRRGGPNLAPQTPAEWGEEELRTLKDQFKEEYRVLERFERPGIVKVYQLFEENGGLFMVMEKLNGATLEDVLRFHVRLAEAQALYVIRRLARTLETIHLSGLIHGDIKPENLFLTYTTEVILLDFGAVNHYLTQDRKAPRFLTPGYAPPEQYQTHRAPDPASDLYALGATLYELLTGFPPPDALERLRGARLPPPSQSGIEVTQETVSAMARTLALAREKRPASAHELLKMLPGKDAEGMQSAVLLDAMPPWIGHSSAVRRLQLTGDANFLASADKTGQLRLWSIPQERCLGVLEFGAEVVDIAIHPDGSWLAVGLLGGQVDILEFSSGRLAGTLRKGSPPVSSLTFSADGLLLLCGLSSGSVEIHDLERRRLKETIKAHEAPINRMAFNPSGRLLGLASNDRSASVWDLKTSRRVRHFDASRRPVQVVTFCNKGGQFLMTGGGEMVLRLFDVKQGDQFRSLKGHEAMVWDILTLDEQDLALTCSADKTLRLWDLRSYRELYRVQDSEGWLQTLAYNPRTNTIYTAGVDGKIYRYYLNDRAIAR
jgi:serine/threonine protein kinase